jgi:hypothetical protein
MERRFLGMWLIALFLFAGCEALASDWPDRRGRTPEQILLDLVRFQQLRTVRASTGQLAHECFTDRDFASFRAAKTPEQIVKRLKQAPDFAVVATALRTLSPERLDETMRAARQTARPTWREMGFIDRQGRGQTEAGHQAELMIAAAIVDAFAGEVRGG